MKRVHLTIVVVVAVLGIGAAAIFGKSNLAEAVQGLKSAESKLQETLNEAAASPMDMEGADVVEQTADDVSEVPQKTAGEKSVASAVFRRVIPEELAAAHAAVDAAKQQVAKLTADFQQTVEERNAAKEEFLAAGMRRQHLLVKQRKLLAALDSATSSVHSDDEVRRREIAVYTGVPEKEAVADGSVEAEANDQAEASAVTADVEPKREEVTTEEAPDEVDKLLAEYEASRAELEVISKRYVTIREALANLVLKADDTDAAVQTSLIEQRRALAKLQILRQMELLYRSEEPSAAVEAPSADADKS